METIKTKEFAKQWIEDGNPCVYRHGWGWKGAGARPITKEEAMKLLPKYSFGKGFYELGFIKGSNGEDVLEFNELSENDMWQYERMMEILSCAMRGRSNGEWHESSHYQKLKR